MFNLSNITKSYEPLNKLKSGFAGEVRRASVYARRFNDFVCGKL